MNPDSQGLNRILQAADAWASSGHTGFQKHIGLFKVGLIGAEEAARRSLNDIKNSCGSWRQHSKSACKKCFIQDVWRRYL